MTTCPIISVKFHLFPPPPPLISPSVVCVNIRGLILPSLLGTSKREVQYVMKNIGDFGYIRLIEI